jgi:hypothetical protein
MRIINNKIVTEKMNRYKQTRLSYYGKQKSFKSEGKKNQKSQKQL